jgi:hypothetical protein
MRRADGLVLEVMPAASASLTFYPSTFALGRQAWIGNTWARVAGATLTAFGLKILGAIVAWIVGRYLIHMALRLIGMALTRQEVDPTLQRYIANIVNVTLNIVLVLAILGYFGVETTSFAALIAGMGVAIGAAWAGLLAVRGWRLPDRVATVQGGRLREGGRDRRHGERDRSVRDNHSDTRLMSALLSATTKSSPTQFRTTR